MYEEQIKALRNVSEYDSGYAKLMYDAADAIEELTRENESLAKSLNEASEILRRRWIPVTERLPEPNAVDEYGFAKGYLVKTDRRVMMHTARYTGKWWVLWGYYEVITDNVTHWMPLPEPPKEES